MENEKKPQVYEGDGAMFNLEKFAEAGYEIHGARHHALIEKTKWRFTLIGASTAIVVDFVMRLIG